MQFRPVLYKLPQQVQAVLVSFKNNALDELAASADCILEITKSSNIEVFSVKEKPQTTQNDDTARKAFSTVKELIAKATMLAHQDTQASIITAVDARLA
ncbi:unnamed protein product [Schistosoma mattheei]|uniref:Uncharacterized protein n=1 Tax=Schistosoma mattheei TaxID=31246 RepID=A0A183PNC7_9TREM|nr:unnamed protein product [Schistosoma mattheei]